MKKALITASVFGFISSFEKNNIKKLLENGYEVHLAANLFPKLKEFGDNGQLENFKIVKHNIDFDRDPKSLKNIKSFINLKKLIEKERYSLIHCHTPVVAMITRLAAINSRKSGTKVIYTAHGFHFYKGSSLLNWLLYFPIEWGCSFFTDILITINKEDYELAKRKLHAKDIQYVPGVGIDTTFDNNLLVNENLRSEFCIPNEGIILLSVGELSKRKNHELVIRALSTINDNNFYYIICGKGDLEEYLYKLVKSLNLEERVIFAGFRKDIRNICSIADIFVFPSFQEGLPVALMEAMSVGLPVICSRIRGNSDLVIHNKGGYLFDVHNRKELERYINNLAKNRTLREKMSNYNLNTIRAYDQRIVLKKMNEIYQIND